jgi:signal transduction histidine kinase
MRFSAFIAANLDSILREWDDYARTLLPAAKSMSDEDLRDHAREILLAIAKDMERGQTEDQRTAKSRRLTELPAEADSAGASHGGARQTAGFELLQLVGEFRALRASVLAHWSRSSEAASGRAAAEEIARFNEALDQALAESVERYSADLARSRDIFLAVLGHDVRGPLSSIRMAADVLVMPSLEEAMRTQVALRVRRASEAIGRLTSDLIEYTRSRLGGGLPIERSACDLLALCEEALDAVRFSCPDQSFEQHFAGDLRIEADGERMRQVVSNLLHNAVQHGDRTLPVTLHAQGEVHEVILKVANFGAPIPPALMRIMFEPLVTVPHLGPAPNERSKTSLGLGLFIVKEIVQGHRGTVSVDSSADQGTVFTVRLPRTQP